MRHKPLIPAPRRERQVDFCVLLKARHDYIEFPASLSYTERPCLKKGRKMEGGRESERQTDYKPGKHSEVDLRPLNIHVYLHTNTHAHHTGRGEKHIRKKEYTTKVRCMGSEECSAGLQLSSEIYLISFRLGLLKGHCLCLPQGGLSELRKESHEWCI